MDRIAGELSIEVVDLGTKTIAAYDYGHRHRNDDFEPLFEHVLNFEKVIFASPVYWYAVSPAMKIFLDRISDYLDLPELLPKGRCLRGKTGYVVATSICPEIDSTYLEAYKKTFRYLGIEYGGYMHANCKDGYVADQYELDIQDFVKSVVAADTLRTDSRLKLR